MVGLHMWVCRSFGSCLCAAQGGLAGHVVHAMHVIPCPLVPRFHDIGLVLVHGVMRVAPSPAQTRAAAVSHTGALVVAVTPAPEANPLAFPALRSLRASLPQMLGTKVTSVAVEGTR